MKCPICGVRLTPVEKLMSEVERIYHCRHCWNRITGWPYLLRERAIEVEITRHEKAAEEKIAA